ncbi:hypothetical protein IFR05_005779 [Cadophora sp. M221]|nr:hypothetical protein IFR05_005779 [Cadophora sp. M221]
MASTPNPPAPAPAPAAPIPIHFPRMEMQPGNRAQSAPLQFLQFFTPGTGRGLHAEEAAAPGKPLARIQKPLFNILEERNSTEFDYLIHGVANMICFLQGRGLLDQYTEEHSRIQEEEAREIDSYGNRWDFKDIYLQFATHGVTIAHPKINIDGFTEHHKSYIATGTCFDDYTSQINHSCVPSCIWVFNKAELQLRAVKNIRAGEELTVSYDAYEGSREENYSQGTVKSHWNGNAHKKRVKKLEDRWGFKCACTLCLGAKDQPFWHTKGSRIDDLVQLLFKIAKYPPPQPIDELPKLLQILTIASQEALPLQSFPLKAIHERIRNHQANSNQVDSALQTSLTLYFDIEPHYSPPLPLSERLSSLRILSEYIELSTRSLNLTYTVEGLCIIQFGMKLKLDRDSETCFGRDSDVAAFLRKMLDAEIKAVGIGSMRTKIDAGSVEMRFAFEMKRMLRWAGFDEEQIRKAEIGEML